MTTESPENGGADIEGAGSKSADQLFSIEHAVGRLKNLKSHGRTGQHLRIGNNVRKEQNASNPSEKKKHKRTQANGSTEETPKSAEENTKTLQKLIKRPQTD